MNTAQRIFDDLLSLEINVVLKSGMTARKMPEPPYALLDIIGEYDMFLCIQGHALNKVWAHHGSPAVLVRPPEKEGPKPPRQTDPDGKLRVPLRTVSVGNGLSFETFDELRERAVEAEAVYKQAAGSWIADDGTGVILKRIYRNCDQIKGILARPDIAHALGRAGGDGSASLTLPLLSDEIITIRKVWDVGTEVVLMQTVAQLDGDVITRIQRGRESGVNKAVHDLHREAVASAMEHWQFLVRTVAEFLTDNVKSFFLR